MVVELKTLLLRQIERVTRHLQAYNPDYYIKAGVCEFCVAGAYSISEHDQPIEVPCYECNRAVTVTVVFKPGDIFFLVCAVCGNPDTTPENFCHGCLNMICSTCDEKGDFEVTQYEKSHTLDTHIQAIERNNGEVKGWIAEMVN